MQNIPLLKEGDTIMIVAPAKHIEEACVTFAKEHFEKQGFHVLIGEHCLGQENYFSGTVENRIHDMQLALDNPKVKAVVCARGGYGSLHVVDRVDWTTFSQSPKWFIGFSDITVFHSRINLMGFPSVHATMPLNFAENSAKALSSLLDAITKETYQIISEGNPNNITGKTVSSIVGGNLSVLRNLLGTDDKLNYSGKILFIEDLNEHLYAIDGMMHAFHKSGVLNEIKGLIVGGMTDMSDTTPSFGQNVEEIILNKVKDLGVPVAFNFPAGHIDDNRAIRFGSPVEFEVSDQSVSVRFSYE